MNLINQLVGQKSPEDKEKLLRVDKASRDYEYFCNNYLPHYFTCSPAPYQKEIYKVINEKRVFFRDGRNHKDVDPN